MMSRSQLVTRVQRELCTASVGQLIGFPGESMDRSWKGNEQQQQREKQSVERYEPQQNEPQQ